MSAADFIKAKDVMKFSKLLSLDKDGALVTGAGAGIGRAIAVLSLKPALRSSSVIWISTLRRP